MADPKLLEILEKGVTEWNKWRDGVRYENHPSIPVIDLRDANFADANLKGIDFSAANLTNADLSRAYLVAADFGDTFQTSFSPERLGEETMECVLAGAKLVDADLSDAVLYAARFVGSDLTGANLSGAALFETVFSNTALAKVKGLESCEHSGPSMLDIRTLVKSGMLPQVFLQGCGIPYGIIEFLPSLIGNPIQFFSCFISYSAQDRDFVNRLYADLQSKGIRCWFAPEALRIGDRFRTRIHESIHVYDKLLVILSSQSICSPWVEEEVETALARERQEGREVLFPIRIDDTVMHKSKAWAESLRNMRHIGDFCNWKNHDDYQIGLDRLIRDLTPEKFGDRKL